MALTYLQISKLALGCYRERNQIRGRPTHIKKENAYYSLWPWGQYSCSAEACSSFLCLSLSPSLPPSFSLSRLWRLLSAFGDDMLNPVLSISAINLQIPPLTFPGSYLAQSLCLNSTPTSLFTPVLWEASAINLT